MCIFMLLLACCIQINDARAAQQETPAFKVLTIINEFNEGNDQYTYYLTGRRTLTFKKSDFDQKMLALTYLLNHAAVNKTRNVTIQQNETENILKEEVHLQNGLITPITTINIDHPRYGLQLHITNTARQLPVSIEIDEAFCKKYNQSQEKNVLEISLKTIVQQHPPLQQSRWCIIQ